MQVLEKLENVRKHRDIKLVTTNKRRNYLVSEPNYHTTKQFSEILLAIKMKKISQYIQVDQYQKLMSFGTIIIKPKY